MSSETPAVPVDETTVEEDHEAEIARHDYAKSIAEEGMRRLARLNNLGQLVIEERLLDPDIWELTRRVDIVQLMLMQLLRNTRLDTGDEGGATEVVTEGVIT
jgi:hypothetical protein